MILLTAGWLGCANDRADLAQPPQTGGDAPTADARVRIDVLPAASADLGDVLALPTSQLRDITAADRVDLGAIDLRSPVRVAGTIRAERTLPTMADVPTQDVAVVGTVRIEIPGTIARWYARTSPSGAFDARVVPDGDHQLTVIPDDPLIPTYSGDLGRPAAFDGLDLGAGAPIYGRVTVDGDGVAGTEVYATSALGVATPVATTDRTGFYQLRVSPGTWTVTSVGRPLAEDATLVAEAGRVTAAGVEVSFARPAPRAALVEGTVRGADGEALGGSVVRVRSESLTGHGPEASFQTEVTVSGNGRYLVQLPLGTYTFELIPAEDDTGAVTSGPVAREGVPVAEDTEIDLDGKRLRPTPWRITDDGGAGLQDARIVCAEDGFDHHEYIGFAGPAGRVELALPPVRLTCEVVPPGDRSELASTRLSIDGSNHGARAVALTAGVALRGEVTIEGSAAASALVQIRDEDGALLGFDVTDEDGAFEVPVDLGP